jgi:DNA-binding transcriptional LysR family regulator
MASASADGLDLAAVRLFLSVVELGSVSKAAVRHSIAQPSATNKLQKLERQLGVSLLDRGPTGSRVTPSGLGLASACAELLASAVALGDRAAALRTDEAQLRIATTRHVAEHHLPEWIAATDHPDLRIELLEMDTLRVVQAVRSGDAALGFTEGPHAPVGLRSEVVATEELVPVVGPAHPWAGRRRSVTPSQIASTPLVLTRSGSGTRDVIEDALGTQRIDALREHIEVDTLAAARIAVASGTAVAFLPRCRVDADIDAGRLFVVPIRSLSLVQSVRVVWRGGAPSMRSARQLVEALGVRTIGRLSNPSPTDVQRR